MRKLPVDLSELETIFETAFDETSYYLDLETGAILAIMHEARRFLNEIYDDLYDLHMEEQADFEELLQAHPMPDWMRDMVREAHQLQPMGSDRFVQIPTADSHEGYRDMEDFVATVKDDRIVELLQVALRGRRPFRRFKDALFRYPAEEQRWFGFKAARLQKRVLSWLALYDIEPAGDPAKT
jgi:hypothetical protein